MIETNIIFLLIVGGFVGAAAGFLGSFMVLKHMSLVGDALSHVALPGIAIALMLHVSPILGAFVALFIAILGVWYFEKTSQVYPEALVGIFFTTSLAIGVLITPEPDLLEALFGSIEKVQFVEGIMAVVLSILIIFITKLISKQLMLGIISNELTKSLKISTNKINFIYLLLVGIVVALGVKFVGTLLTGALVIIPAASAKNLSSSLRSYYSFSAIFGVVSALMGVFIAGIFHVPSGPIVVLAGIFIFLITYLKKIA